MAPETRKLALLQVVAGPLVLVRYAWCIALYPEASMQMWGGVPESLRQP